jgi:stringent starvation protein B
MSHPSLSKRPYLIRAMHEWMCDNGHTPHIVVDTSFDGVAVPQEHIKDGKIILNISETAARARFGGVPFDVWAPIRAVLGIYARETGQGMIFSHDSEQSAAPELKEEVEDTRSRPHLTIVK